MKILDLVLIGKWYDMIKSVEKPEEYRDTLFWAARLLNVDREGTRLFHDNPNLLKGGAE